MKNFLKGKKTYIAAAAAAAIAVAQVLGYPIPEWVFTLLASLGIIGVRSAIGASN